MENNCLGIVEAKASTAINTVSVNYYQHQLD